MNEQSTRCAWCGMGCDPAHTEQVATCMKLNGREIITGSETVCVGCLDAEEWQHRKFRCLTRYGFYRS